MRLSFFLLTIMILTVSHNNLEASRQADSQDLGAFEDEFINPSLSLSDQHEMSICSDSGDENAGLYSVKQRHPRKYKVKNKVNRSRDASPVRHALLDKKRPIAQESSQSSLDEWGDLGYMNESLSGQDIEDILVSEDVQAQINPKPQVDEILAQLLNVGDEHVIVSDELANIIKLRLGFEDDLPQQYKDIRMLQQIGIRFVILDCEWDKSRNMTEVSAVEFLNGNRGRILFKKFNTQNPARNELKTIFEFIRGDRKNEFLTLTIAHNAPADVGILFHELYKHYHSLVIHPDMRLSEDAHYTTYWLDSYRFLLRKWQISEGSKHEQIKIREVDFSMGEAILKHQKANEDKLKRMEAKKRKLKRIRLAEKDEECRLIEAGLLNSDGSFSVDSSDAIEEDASSQKPSFKLKDAFTHTGVDMTRVLKRLKIPPVLSVEKGIAATEFDSHNALYDTLMTWAVMNKEYDEQYQKNPPTCVKTLLF